jgi:glycerate-2-kinase
MHAALKLLETTGDLVVTGPTGTNVNDLKLLLVGC